MSRVKRRTSRGDLIKVELLSSIREGPTSKRAVVVSGNTVNWSHSDCLAVVLRTTLGHTAEQRGAWFPGFVASPPGEGGCYEAAYFDCAFPRRVLPLPDDPNIDRPFADRATEHRYGSLTPVRVDELASRLGATLSGSRTRGAQPTPAGVRRGQVRRVHPADQQEPILVVVLTNDDVARRRGLGAYMTAAIQDVTGFPAEELIEGLVATDYNSKRSYLVEPRGLVCVRFSARENPEEYFHGVVGEISQEQCDMIASRSLAELGMSPEDTN